MNKKFDLKLNSRRISSVAVCSLLLLSVTSCSSGYVSGDIATDDVYATIGNYTVTKGELWEEFRWNTKDLLTNRIEEVVYQPYEELVEKYYGNTLDGSEDEKAIAWLNETYQGSTSKDPQNGKKNAIAYINMYCEYDIYAFSEFGGRVYDLEDDFIDKKIKIYADSMYTKYGITVDKDAIKNGDYASLYQYYYKQMAKRLFARNVLLTNIDEAKDNRSTVEDDDYFTTSQIVSAWKNQFHNKGDIDLLMVRFLNEDEANNTLRAFGIKVYKNAWYYLGTDEPMSYYKYCKYYDDFTMSATSIRNENVHKIETEVGEAGILQLYIEMYNYIYTYRSALENTNPTWAQSDSQDRRNITQDVLASYVNPDTAPTFEQVYNNIKDSEYINYTAEEINDINSSLKNYAYSTLQTSAYEEGESYTRYSTSAKSYGSYYYLVFKLDAQPDEDGFYYPDITDDDLYACITGNVEDENYKNNDVYNKIYDYLIENEVSQSYVDNEVSKAVKDVGVKIYDQYLEIAYSAENSDYSKTHGNAPDGNTLAVVSYDGRDMALTANECYEELELTSGTTTAIDILSKKIIKDTDYFKNHFDQKDYDDYEKTLNYMLASFANNSFSSYGYPASIGKYNFLMLYFHTANVNDVIENYYKLNDTSSYLLNGYFSEDLMQFFKKYVLNAYENFFSLTGTRLYVYIDENEDGNPDDLDLDGDGIADGDTNWSTEQYEAAIELLGLVNTKLQNSSDEFTTTLDSLVSSFNTSGRFTNGIDTPVVDGDSHEFDPTTPESNWAKYRRLGLYLGTEEITVTNTSDVDSRILNMFETLYFSEEFQQHDIFQSQMIDTANQGFIYENSYNLLILTSGATKESFEFTTDDDVEEIYTNLALIFKDKLITIEDAYSDTEGDEVIPSINQIKLYLYEYLNYDGSTVYTPSAITSAMETYFKPVITRYTADATQREILLQFSKYITNGTLTFADSANNARFEELLNINKRTADDYAESGSNTNTFDGWWDDLAEGQWWTTELGKESK